MSGRFLRRAAIRALGEMGSYAESQISELAKLKDDPDGKVRRAAQDVLGYLGYLGAWEEGRAFAEGLEGKR